MLSWFRRRSAPPIVVADQAAVLARNVWQTGFLPVEWRERHTEVVSRMVGERNWEGAGGLAVTDEMRVTVAGVAALLTLGYDDRYTYPDLPSIVLYPGAYQAQRSEGSGWLDLLGGEHADSQGSGRLGEAWRRGPIVLSWPDVLRSARRPGRGHNLVLHEFAHYVDGLDGETDGVPMVTGEAARHWPGVVGREYDRLVAQSRRGELTLLDQYGATSKAEFFAVATECFFERPHEMQGRHAELFGLMADFYRQDPSEWLPRLAPRRRAAPPSEAPLQVDLSGLGLEGADVEFAEGQQLLAAGEAHAAVEAFSRALELEPHDAETLTLRAAAKIELHDWESALEDARQAIAADPEHALAHAAAAEALIELDDRDAAERHAQTALRLDRDSLDALFFCGTLAFQAGRLREAKKSLRRLVLLDRQWGEAHYWLACVYEQMGDSKSAQRHFALADWLAAEPEEEATDAAD
ncbi:Protein MtfA [Botrimarina colliarenosi]|uniref:Protein MtfA n=1 Tax=Botrimarina colliarenosi TaxID=2528001 RepID=A0A5C6AHU9_9BACT|nr:M90 family metallopeptidase [Botrimarina colliarenosi]TWT97793.1 Protein MtfA [Botrimarina colliarenosi]